MLKWRLFMLMLAVVHALGCVILHLLPGCGICATPLLTVLLETSCCPCLFVTSMSAIPCKMVELVVDNVDDDAFSMLLLMTE